MSVNVFYGDVHELKELIDSYKLEIGEETTTDEQLDILSKAIESQEIVFFVAYGKGKPVGICSVSYTFSTYNFSRSGVFEDFYVHPDYRGSGIAHKLVEYVIGYCRKNGVRTLWVGCCDGDINMYKKLGFVYPLGNLLCWSDEK